MIDFLILPFLYFDGNPGMKMGLSGRGVCWESAGRGRPRQCMSIGICIKYGTGWSGLKLRLLLVLG